MHEEKDRPAGYVWIGAFFVFGATMSAYAAITLLKPGTVLDAAWGLNKQGHAGLLPLGRAAGLMFIVLSALLALAAVGWFRRRRWGWGLGVAIIAMNMAGDIFSAIGGQGLKGAFGVVVAGTLLIYVTRPTVRGYFGN